MLPKDRKVVILKETLYNDREFWYPYYRLQEEGAETWVVGPKDGGEFRGKDGIVAPADLGMHDAKESDFDAIVIPGGYAPDHMRRHPAMAW